MLSAINSESSPKDAQRFGDYVVDDSDLVVISNSEEISQFQWTEEIIETFIGDHIETKNRDRRPSLIIEVSEPTPEKLSSSMMMIY